MLFDKIVCCGISSVLTVWYFWTVKVSIIDPLSMFLEEVF